MDIKKCHVKKFSRLVYELQHLLQDIQKYCPNAIYRLHDTSDLEIGIDTGDPEDFPYYTSMRLDCEAINDVGLRSYCLVSEDEEAELRYYGPESKKPKSSYSPKGVKFVSREDVEPYYRGYVNSLMDPETALTIEQFALQYKGWWIE